MTKDPRFAAVWLAVSLIALASPARAAVSGDVTLVLPRSTALDLREKLANAPAMTPLEVLGLEDAALFEPVVPVPLRDGVRLSANILLPKDKAQQRLPVILIRSPYTPSGDRKSVV